MIIVDSCMIWFHLDRIMQLKKSYHIATNVCSRKSAITFGDLPDWSRARELTACSSIAYITLTSPEQNFTLPHSIRVLL